MGDIKPPSYEESLAAGPSHSVSSINSAFVPDEEAHSPPSVIRVDLSSFETPLLNLRSLTDEQLREACHTYIDETCCYGSRFLRDMILTDIHNDCAFRYTLESYGEKREPVKQSTGYYGQTIDGPENGPAPNPWDIYVNKPAMFTDHRTTMEIPHTAYVKQCGVCVGNKEVRCESCYGQGTKKCTWCNGRGERTNGDDTERCTRCNGTGRRTCTTCDGRGMVQCRTCSGHGKLKHFRMLIVSWTNHKDVSISNTFNLPKELIQEFSGRELLREQDVQISPVTNAVDSAVNEASAYLLTKHERSFRNEKILQQRQTIVAVPFTKATYIWRRKKGEFYVYGFHNKVYFEEYPQRCCCCTCC